MKILSILCLLVSVNIWAQCPAAKYKFKEKPINYSKVFLIPGAGSENDDLYLGHIRYGKYYAAYIAELEKEIYLLRLLNLPQLEMNQWM